MLCAESQVLCRAVEGVGSFGTVIELNILKKHTAVIYMVLAAALQPLVGGQQIQRRKQRVILSVYILCGKCKSCPVLFIYICHGVFLAFYIFVESLAEGRTAYLPHGGRQYLRGCGGGCRDEYLCFGKTEAHRLRRCRCNRRVRPCGPLCALFTGSPSDYPTVGFWAGFEPLCGETGIQRKKSRRKSRGQSTPARTTSARSAGSFRLFRLGTK